MKKTFIFGLMAAALGFTACSSDDDLNVINNTQKGMVLRATVEQPTETRATINDSKTTWKFAFATDDNVSVTNSSITGTYYTFTNDGTTFNSEDAQTTESAATWYAYFPSNEVSLVNQSGKMTDVANKYALAGKTASATTGKDGLTISMSPKVAILVIDNQKGAIDINVKASKDTWVSGLNASEDGFTVTTESTKQTLLSATETGKYYVAVPAGVQLSVKDGDKVIKSTGTSGLVAGKYYNISVAIKTVADILATVDGGFPEDKSGGKTPVAPSNAWTNGNGSSAFIYSPALILQHDGYTYGQLTTKVTKGENCYTASISYGNLEFNMTNGILTSFKFIPDPSKPNAANYVGTYTAPTTN